MTIKYVPNQRPNIGGISALIKWAGEEFNKIQLAFKLYAASIYPKSYGLDILDPDGNDSCAIVFRDSENTDMSAIITNHTTDEIEIQNRIISGEIDFSATTAADSLITLFKIDPDTGLKLAALDDFQIHKKGSGAIQRITFDYPDVSTDICLFDIGLNTDTSGNVFFRLYDGQNSAWEIRAQSGNGTQFGSPTGGFKGAGTINAKAVYDDNSLLTDYVFDGLLDGNIDFEKWDSKAGRSHTPARLFNARLNDLDPKEYARKWKQARKLPAFIEGEEQKSLGDIAQRLLETCEVQAIHIDKLLERIEKLEEKNGNPANPN